MRMQTDEQYSKMQQCFVVVVVVAVAAAVAVAVAAAVAVVAAVVVAAVATAAAATAVADVNYFLTRLNKGHSVYFYMRL